MFIKVHFFIYLTLMIYVWSSKPKGHKKLTRLAKRVKSEDLPNGRYMAMTKGRDGEVCSGLTNLTDFVMDVSTEDDGQVANITSTVDGINIITKKTVPLMWHCPPRMLKKFGEFDVPKPPKCFGLGTRSDHAGTGTTIAGEFMKDMLTSLGMSLPRLFVKDIIFCKDKQDVIVGLGIQRKNDHIIGSRYGFKIVGDSQSKPIVGDIQPHAGSSNEGNFRKRRSSLSTDEETSPKIRRSSSPIDQPPSDYDEFLCDEGFDYEPKWFITDESTIGDAAINEQHGHERIIDFIDH